MKFSWWNQYWEHKEIISLSSEETYKKLLSHYKQSAKSFTLDEEQYSKYFRFNRGNSLCSAFVIGSELWCKHIVVVDVKKIEGGKTQVYWKINLKLFGVQVGKNAIVEECKNFAQQYA